jgi:predicted DNA-binding protein
MAYERVQILLEPGQHRALKLAAKRAKKSVSELVREMTEKYFTEKDEMLEALDTLRAIRERQPVYKGNPIAEARAEREAQTDEVLKPWE